MARKTPYRSGRSARDTKCGLDRIIPPESQNSWLESLSSPITDYTRRTDPTLLSKQDYAGQKLLNDENFVNEVLPVMARYIRLCILEPYLTEKDYWGCSCLPDSPNRAHKIYSRINMRFQEVFTASYEYEWQTVRFSWHVLREPVLNDIPREVLATGPIRLIGHYYPSGGTNQICVEAYDKESAFQLLVNPVFIHAAKKFNLERMRSGHQPYSRYHARALADRILPERPDSIS